MPENTYHICNETRKVKKFDQPSIKSYKDYVCDVRNHVILVKERAKRIVEQRISNPITKIHLDNRLSNYQEPEKQFLSALLLDRLIFRSSEQTSAFLHHALDFALPNAVGALLEVELAT